MTERELLKILSDNIKLYRGRYKWSQAKLAEKIDVSIQFLSDIENVKKWPSPTTLVKFADIFNIAVYELLMPKDILPDSSNHIHVIENIIMENYTEDVFRAITKVHDAYVSKLNKKR